MRVLLFVVICAASALAGLIWIAAPARKAVPRNWWWLLGFLWVPLAAGFLLVMFDRQAPKEQDLECPVPSEDYVFGPSTWQAWPPGTVCYDLDGNVTSRPDAVTGAMVAIASGGTAVFLVAGAVALRRGLT